jgi:hypothetical protein
MKGMEGQREGLSSKLDQSLDKWVFVYIEL